MTIAHHGLLMGDGSGVNTDALSLYSARVAWWDFEENNATASFLDSTGNSNTLSILAGGASTASSVMSATGGKVGRQFSNASNQDTALYIPRSNTALDLPNTDWSFGGWFEGGNDGGVSGSTAFLMGRLGSGGATFQSWFYIEASDGLFYMRASTDGTSLTTLSSGISAGAGDKWLIVATLDRANNLIRFRIKRASGSVNANVTAAFAGALYTGATNANFCISDGLSNDNTFFSGNRSPVSAKYDSCFYFSKAISTAEIDYLYNSGNGLNWATLAAAAGH